MTVKLSSTAQWEAICPRCNKTVYTHEDLNCENCQATTRLQYPLMGPSKFESKDAYYSWFGLHCSKECGWQANVINCPECNAEIQGKYLQNHHSNRTLFWRSINEILAIVLLCLAVSSPLLVILFFGWISKFW